MREALVGVLETLSSIPDGRGVLVKVLRVGVDGTDREINAAEYGAAPPGYDFLVIGPKADPAGLKGRDVVAALGKLVNSPAPFVSRGDKSGTHAAELRYWKAAGVHAPASALAGYKDCGCGMGPALNIASSGNAYLLADRGTWLSFKNRGELAVLVEGDTRLFNQYGVIVVNPARHPHVKKDLAQAFADWVLGAEGQATIASYKVGGEPLFFPNAKP